MMNKTLLVLAALLCTMGTWAEGIQMLNRTTAEVTLKSGQRMYIDFYGPHTFRVFEDPNGGIIRDPEAVPAAKILVDNPRVCPGQVTLQGKSVSTKEICVNINTETGQIMVSKGNRRILEQTAPTEFSARKTTVQFAQSPTDYFYGGGVQNGRFSHKNQIIAIENTNNWVSGGVASPTPFYWSTAGYGIMWYTFTPGRYDFGATNATTTSLYHETDYLDMFVMVDDGAVALLNDFYQITGNPVLLPKFGFYEGHLNAYNRDYWTKAEDGKGFMKYEDGSTYNESQKDNGGIKESLNGEKNNYQFCARAALDRYLENDYPLGWFLPNDGYGAGYGQAGSLDGNIQNLKNFGDYARSKGVEIGLWTQSDLHPKEGVEPLLQRDIVKEVGDAGVRVLKTDVAWVGAGYSFGLNGVADVAQVMPYYGNNARPFIISLDGWAGTQRYAGIWTGDQTGGEWEYIRFHIPTYIGSGLSGQPNITSDMDGIFGGKNLPMNVRDFEWKTFSPMQLNMDGWGSNPKYPQALGEPAAGINRYYLHLKSRLLPYTYSIAREAVDGKPMIRAMFLEEENPYTLGTRTQYQFMYGPSILVAPIYKETRMDKDGNDVRDGIYLPKGEWVDYFTGDIYQGGRIINNFDAPLWKLPILVKRGAIIPMHKPTNTPKDMDSKLRAYDIYPMGESTFVEYDDDAKTVAYLHGQSTMTPVKSILDEKGNLTVSISTTRGSYDGFEKSKTTQLRVYCSAEPKKVVAKVGKTAVKLTKAADYQSWKKTPNTYYYGLNAADEYRKTPAMMVNLDETDVTANGIVVSMQGVTVDSSNKLLQKHGALTAPRVRLDNVKAYTMTPEWDAEENADYYEVEFEDQVYSNIAATSYEIDALQAETHYSMKVRAVNADGQSPWTEIEANTKADPLQYAIHGIKGETSCDNQGGQGVNHLFDFDETSIWHTAWGKVAVPFDLTIDLKSVNVLDKLQYIPRPDAGNGTLLEGTIETSMDRINWTNAQKIEWAQNGETKQLIFEGAPTARFVRMHITKGVGNFGSGYQMYIFRKRGSDWFIPGDINQDGRLDENDLTSYMNYTGLRQGDGDFEGYVSKGDLNGNGLIDVYDISAVAVELNTGVSSKKVPQVAGKITVKADKQMYNAGDEARITVSGKDMVSVNGISMALPYDANDWEYVGIEPVGISQMYNMTYDRLHTSGQKALYPTFVNLGEEKYAEGDQDLFVIKMKSKKRQRYTLKAQDGMIVDKYQNVVRF